MVKLLASLQPQRSAKKLMKKTDINKKEIRQQEMKIKYLKGIKGKNKQDIYIQWAVGFTAVHTLTYNSLCVRVSVTVWCDMWQQHRDALPRHATQRSCSSLKLQRWKKVGLDGLVPDGNETCPSFKRPSGGSSRQNSQQDHEEAAAVTGKIG